MADRASLPDDQPLLQRERRELLRQLEELLDRPMTALGFVWLLLLILDLTRGLGLVLQWLSDGIWALFVLHFVLGLVIAPERLDYLRRNWLTALALLLPAFRVLRAFRFLRVGRAVRSLSLLRLVTSVNRGMGSARQALGRRGVGYVVSLTAIFTFAGAAGMAYFESPAALQETGQAASGSGATGLGGYGEALWWTAMLMTTLGSEYWPKTLEGRLLAFLLALYALAVFGYLTAAIASFFVGRDVSQTRPAADGLANELAALRREVALLRAQLGQPERPPGPGSEPTPGSTRREP